MNDTGNAVMITAQQGDSFTQAWDWYFTYENLELWCSIGHGGVDGIGCCQWTLTQIPPVLVLNMLRFMSSGAVTTPDTLFIRKEGQEEVRMALDCRVSDTDDHDHDPHRPMHPARTKELHARRRHPLPLQVQARY